MLQNLVSDISHSGFFYTHAGQYFCIFFNFFANAGNDLFSLVHGHSLYDQFRLLGSLDRIIHILENPMFSGRSFRNLHFCHNFLYNFLYHVLTDWHEIVLLTYSVRIISFQAVPLPVL